VSRRARAVSALLVAVALLFPATALEGAKKKKSSKPPAAANFDTKLPVLGTKLTEFPPGPGKKLADEACLACHAADMVWQQRLNEKQWTAEVNKMAGWGAPVPEKDRAGLVEYLVANFGPENDKFEPVVTRPVGK
jgi:cytochrome c5